MTIREEGLIVKDQVLSCYLKGKRCLFVIVKILKDSSNSFLCTVQNKNGDQYVKKWFSKHENNKELGRPTFKEVEKDWKENRESFMYPDIKALY
ncbi:hypothetical protein IEC_00259 [Bacillus toyonensis]|nr:hypothetical protein IEC_00259 [Bacillus toyonensis]PEC64950.1 hypothetical protein CON62_25610 [Bacillus toyonensis]PEM62070.1 hypothetical protein CN625_12160 [Bacillus toyonensis]PEN75003.1 hypothetical protein CN539_15085 [Bacillus toyonensis]PEN82288.1 hypothetical protein CN544_10725 [Bacillus toyonensis]